MSAARRLLLPRPGRPPPAAAPAPPRAPRPAHPVLRVGPANDPLEREADRVAEAALSGAPAARVSPAGPATLRRACACAAGSGGGCEECERKRLRRKEAGPGPDVAPSIVHDVLASPGRPLDEAARADLEPRLGHSLAHVRVHDDVRAAASARAVGALAYAVGRDVVFDAGQYAPSTERGRRLLAHELAHTLQQDGGHARPVLRRRERAIPGGPPPCYDSPVCSEARIPGSAWDFSHAAQEKERENEAALRRDPALRRALGPVRTAASVLAVLRAQAPGLLQGVADVLVNPALGGAAGAQVGDCSLDRRRRWPRGSVCLEVPAQTEQEAAEFGRGAATVGGLPREIWASEIVRKVTHEAAHVRFTANEPASVRALDEVSRFELDELNALLAEFPVLYHAKLRAAEAAGEDTAAVLPAVVGFYVEKKGEGIRGILLSLRCTLPCATAAEAIRTVFDAQTASWDPADRDDLLRELTDPRRLLDWPMPAPVPRPTVPRPDVPRPEPERRRDRTPLYRPRTGFPVAEP